MTNKAATAREQDRQEHHWVESVRFRYCTTHKVMQEKVEGTWCDVISGFPRPGRVHGG